MTGGLAFALLLGYVTQRLGLSPIVGYLLAGIAVGPYTPGFVANRDLAEQLAEIGVILLMFGIASAIVSISLNPIFNRLVDRLEARAKRSPRLSRWLSGRARVRATEPVTATDPTRTSVIVVGYGPVGRTLVRLLRENGMEPTVIELNLDTVRRLRSEGLRAIYGDATHKETVKEAGAHRAAAFILSSSGMHGSQEAIRLAREINPEIRVFARSGHLRELPALRRAGADMVFAGEGEVALAMTEFLLRQLGATAEQIDRERDRIRTELFGGPLSVEQFLPVEHASPAGTDRTGG